MQDLFTVRLSNQISFLESAFVGFATKAAIDQFKKSATWLWATPVIGPFASWVLSFIVSKILGRLVKNGDFQAYFINTRRRADAQAERFDKLVDARSNAQNAEELKHAEDLANKAFDGVVKYSR